MNGLETELKRMVRWLDEIQVAAGLAKEETEKRLKRLQEAEAE